ncbi:MAG: GAF domain-containing protein [Eubacteriales bacterium]|nr:GAF domain-containing protein [Eubacteriales bacterium]
MAYTPVAYPDDKPAFYQVLREQLALHLADAPTAVTALANASAVLSDALGDCNWIGFYLVRGDRLVLGPFQGKPAVVEIPYARGVCGAAWQQKATQVVRDVHAFAGHIACDCASASELAVPLFAADGRVLGILDCDSPLPARFDEKDAAEMDAIAADLASRIANLA